MASDKDFVEFVADQIKKAGDISYRKMFGEYAVYCDGKVIALICDNHLFIKQTEGGRIFIGNVVEAPPYSGAKMHFLIEDQFEDSEWISELVRITTDELPVPKPRKPRKRGKK
jgi:TfoX/Sxy family transcriptional regulator of competence genes